MPRATTCEVPRGLLQAAQVAHRLGIGKSSWNEWVKGGLVEKGIKLGYRTVVWDSRYIDAVIDRIASGELTTQGLYSKKKEAPQ